VAWTCLLVGEGDNYRLPFVTMESQNSRLHGQTSMLHQSVHGFFAWNVAWSVWKDFATTLGSHASSIFWHSLTASPQMDSSAPRTARPRPLRAVLWGDPAGLSAAVLLSSPQVHENKSCMYCMGDDHFCSLHVGTGYDRATAISIHGMALHFCRVPHPRPCHRYRWSTL